MVVPDYLWRGSGGGGGGTRTAATGGRGGVMVAAADKYNGLALVGAL